MPLNTWLKIFDAIAGVSDLTSRFRAAPEPIDANLAPGARLLGQLETRLAAVVVAALKEAFDRDSARLELEQAQIEAERRRVDEALRLELLRQAVDREVARLRAIAAAALASWITSVLFFMRVAGGGLGLASKLTVAAGWGCLLGALACGLAAQASAASLASTRSTGDGVADLSRARIAVAATRLLVVGLALTALSLLLAL